jgi:hypothetical protein
VHRQEGHDLRDQLAAWATGIAPKIAGVYPTLPEGVEDRAADVWEALLAVADAMGGDWPKRARVAAVSLVTAAREGTPSLGIRLLADLRAIFGSADAMPTMAIIEQLIQLDESPWADIRGKPIDARRLANYLLPYSIKRKAVRIGGKVFKGLRREDLADSWARYLPPLPSVESVTSVTTVAGGADVTVVTDVTDLADGGCSRCGGEGCEWCVKP